MPHTSDNDKKAQDNQALKHENNDAKKIVKPVKTNIQKKPTINRNLILCKKPGNDFDSPGFLLI